jgi:uncharacterized protein
MQKLKFFLLGFLVAYAASAQEITGSWNGLIKGQFGELRIVFNIDQNGSDFTATMDSPDQGAKGIPVSKATFDGSKLKLEIDMAKIQYEGILSENSIKGTFRQSGMEIPLDLTKETLEKTRKTRPQDPQKPYPYHSEDVKFDNKQANLVLAGTLTLPKGDGKFPVVVLISGSGPQNRDEEIMGHRPFLVIADYLTRNGIAVLRYDDRGVGESSGDFSKATSVDFATDVESAVAYLKTRPEIDHKKIGLIGHSEGGIIAPMVAANSKDVAFIVLLAGTGIRGDKLLLLQQELIFRASGMTESDIKNSKKTNSKIFEMIIASKDDEKLKADLEKYIRLSVDQAIDKLPAGTNKEDFIMQQLDQINSPWMKYFIKYDPATALQKVKCPVLAVNGEKDLQVPPKENLGAIEKALKKAGNKKVTTKEFPGLNHLFQECTTGSPAEYATIEQTFSPAVLQEMVNWMGNTIK